MKKMVDIYLENIKYDISGPIDEAIKKLKDLRKEHGPGVYLDVGEESEPYSYSDQQYAYVKAFLKREETDEEYANRLIKEKNEKSRQEAVERQTFERLKKKFGE